MKTIIKIKQATIMAIVLTNLIGIAVTYLGCNGTDTTLYNVQIKITSETEGGGQAAHITYKYNVHRGNEVIKEDEEDGITITDDDNAFYGFIDIGEYYTGDTINVTFNTGEYDNDDELWYRTRSTLYFYLNGKKQTNTYTYNTNKIIETASFTIE